MPLTHEAVTRTALKRSRRWSAPAPKVRKGLTNMALRPVATSRMPYTPLRFSAAFFATSYTPSSTAEARAIHIHISYLRLNSFAQCLPSGAVTLISITEASFEGLTAK